MKKKLLILFVFQFLIISFVYSSDRILKVVAPWEIRSNDPTSAGYIFSRMQVGETLVEVDKNGNLIPGLATQWNVSSDYLTWTFDLRKGVRFHDQTKMTAEHVVLSLNHALKHSSVLKKAPITSIETLGNKVQVKLSSPFAPLAATLAHFSNLIFAPSSYDSGKVVKVLGTGPYQISLLEPPQKMEVELFQEYWGDKPQIKKASYLAVGRGETRVLMAESRDADIVYTIDPISLKRMKQQGNVGIHAESIPRTVVIKVNATHPFLSNVQARQAISEAIDRRGIANGVMRIKDAAAFQLFPPILGIWHLDHLNHSKGGIERSKRLLTQLGWKLNDSGILEKDGIPFRLTIHTYASRPILPVIATALQDQFRDIGIDLKVSIGNSSAIPKGHQDGSLDLALIARNYGLVPDPLGTVLQDYGSQGGDWGAMNWSNRELQKSLTALQQENKFQNQKILIQKISKVLFEELPTIPVVYYQHTAIVNKDLDGFSLDPLERSYRISELSWK